MKIINTKKLILLGCLIAAILAIKLGTKKQENLIIPTIRNPQEKLLPQDYLVSSPKGRIKETYHPPSIFNLN